MKLNHDPFCYDKLLLFSCVILALLGLLMVASASMVVSAKQFHTHFHYVIRHGIYLCLGGFAAFCVTRFPMMFWEKMRSVLLIVSLLLLVLVLVPGVGRSVNGSTRWLGVGFLSLQVSELAKLAAIIFFGHYLVSHQVELRTSLQSLFKPLLLLGVIGVLLLLEPDFGTTTVILMTVLGLAFLGGVRFKHFVGLLACASLGLGALAIVSPYRLARLTSFLNPWSHPYGSGYQLTQSLIAFGRGGVFGLGLGSSIQKLFYLPEAHTDFLFAILGEELGLVGMLGVLTLYSVMIMRIFQIGRRAFLAEQHASGYIAMGIGLWLSMQVMINIGVNTGVLPTKGLTLPLLSYGGSSIVVVCMALGMLFRIDYEARFGGNSVARLRKRRYHRL
jgi:cell division protein FtsW